MALLNGFMPGETAGIPNGYGNDYGQLGGLLSGNDQLLNVGLGILANNHGNYGSFGAAIGKGVQQGIQQNQQAKQLAEQTKLRDYQIKKSQQEQDEYKAQQDALKDFDIKFPQYAGLARLDPKSALKIAYPKIAEANTDYGLIPQIGIDPKSGEQRFFIQDKGGNTKWLDAAVPPKPQFVAPTEYNPGYFVDPRNPNASPIPIQQPQQQPQGGNFGLPQRTDPRAPWTNLQSPKQIDEAKQKAYTEAQKQLDEVNAAVSQGAGTQADLNRFLELNNQTGTGSLADRTILPSLTNDKREMEAITARLAPSVRVPGSGTTSDRDIALYLQGLPGVDKPGDVNKSIVDQYGKSYTKAQEKQSFYNAYLQEYGHLNGAAELFEKDYQANHPQAKAKPTTPAKKSTMTGGGWSAKKVN